MKKNAFLNLPWIEFLVKNKQEHKVKLKNERVEIKKTARD